MNRRVFKFLITLTLFLRLLALDSEATAPANLMNLTATVRKTPTVKITINFPSQTGITPTSHAIFRRAKGATSWTSIATPGASAVYYDDTTVSVGSVYEYK